ncbi:MAG: class I SAM-dependent methyltransferase [Pseudomonadota bacterium]
MSEQTLPATFRGIHGFVAKYVRAMPDLTGKTVVDIPCGDGRTTREFLARGADVVSLDLFPEFFKVDGQPARYADLSERLPLADESCDLIVCQEGIEHVPNQLFVLEEFNRVLKPGGQLLLTTPNYSHLRARLSQFLFETDFWKRMPPTEVDSVWFSEKNADKLYFGHLFLIGAQKLATLLTLAGFEVEQRVKTDVGTTSVLLGVTYPLLALASLLTRRSYRRKVGHVDATRREAVFAARLKLNLAPTTLFCKHLFWVSRKQASLPARRDELRALTATEHVESMRMGF